MMKRYLLFVALLGMAAFSLAGCGTQVTGADIVQHLRDTAASTNTAHIVVTLKGQVNGAATSATVGSPSMKDMTGDVTAEVWYQKPNLLRAVVLAASKPELVGAILVHDGSYIWAYDPKQKMAYKVDSNALRELAGKANIPADLQDMLANPNLQNAIDQLLALTDYTLVGSEKVGAYQTYRLDLVPKAGSPAATVLVGAKATLWVDQNTWVPVKATVDAKQGNGSMEMTTLELNKPAPAGTFTFSLPNGGHVVDLSGMVPRAMTIMQARQTAQAAGFHLLEPAYLPANSTLVQVMGSSGIMGKGANVTMSYSGGSNAPAFWISEGSGDHIGFGPDSQRGQAPAPAVGEAVTVRGVQGHFAVSPAEKAGGTQTAILSWQEKGTSLQLSIGGQLSKDEMLKIAESMK